MVAEKKPLGLFAYLDEVNAAVERGEEPPVDSPPASARPQRVRPVTASMAKRIAAQQLAYAALDAADLLRRAVQPPVAYPIGTRQSDIPAQSPDPTATQVRAAIAILDRTGFGPSSTVAVDDPDPKKMTTKQLLQRLETLRQQLLTRMNDGDDDDDHTTH